ncbi:hypothetical protein PRZ48_011321 [Zasmidium cellare]|uniref:Uncharacterized protein n=1 Tax=Zasmidium cellare TaxID=395010 RepID=A0ABR0E610_ZASCE|nr:hypothetical protein PRZ48_011321 [Zasmidium cellare]
MRDVSYGLWYGQNQFIVELASVALTSEVQLGVEVPIMVDVEDREHPLSWSRICARGSLSVPYPSSSFTMRYITDLTICINLSSSNSSQAEHLELSQQLRSLVTCFGDDASNLRRLAVSLDVCKKRYKHFKSQRLELCGDPPRMMLRETIPTDHVNMTPRQSSYLEKLVQPLFQLRGVGDMTVRWLLPEEFAATLTESAMQPPERDSVPEELSRKRVRRAK